MTATISFTIEVRKTEQGRPEIVLKNARGDMALKVRGNTEADCYKTLEILGYRVDK